MVKCEKNAEISAATVKICEYQINKADSQHTKGFK